MPGTASLMDFVATFALKLRIGGLAYVNRSDRRIQPIPNRVQPVRWSENGVVRPDQYFAVPVPTCHSLTYRKSACQSLVYLLLQWPTCWCQDAISPITCCWFSGGNPPRRLQTGPMGSTGPCHHSGVEGSSDPAIRRRSANR